MTFRDWWFVKKQHPQKGLLNVAHYITGYYDPYAFQPPKPWKMQILGPKNMSYYPQKWRL